MIEIIVNQMYNCEIKYNCDSFEIFENNIAIVKPILVIVLK